MVGGLGRIYPKADWAPQQLRAKTTLLALAEGGGAAYAKAVGACRTMGVSGGGQDAAARQSMEDLKSYVRRHLLGG